MSYQTAPSFESKKNRYASADTPQHIYKQIRKGAEKFFTEKKYLNTPQLLWLTKQSL